MNILPLPPLELLQERYYISEDSPSGLRNKKQLGARALQNAVAGCKKTRGYWYVTIDGIKYLAHRIVYYLKTKNNPKNLFVDHRQSVNIDAIDVRLATPSDNSCNSKPRNGKEYKGVAQKSNGSWWGRITKNGKAYYTGTFATLKEACDAYDEKARELHGEYAWLNLLQ